MNDRHFTEPMASVLDNLRAVARTRKPRGKRLTYDCANAIVGHNGVTCKLGHKFTSRNPEGVMSLLLVLQGRGSTVCQRCKEFEENEEGTA